MRIAVIGHGRMGRMIDTVCAQGGDVEVVGFVGRGACASLDDIADIDAAVDFSYPGNLTMLLESAVRRRLRSKPRAWTRPARSTCCSPTMRASTPSTVSSAA